MLKRPLVSIIIPTYNRAYLIGETLDSVLAQSYTNWECIVVDDRSTDGTDTLMAKYMDKDSRFQYNQRPMEKPKGANACRNYGLQLAKGEFINWFDSDDLMQPNFLSRKLDEIEQKKVDFVVSKSLNFDEEGTYEVIKYKGNFLHQLSAKNYILKKVYWMTPDFFIKREFLTGHYFNETLKSGQETNFFIVFLNKSNLLGVAIDEHLSLRRLHNSSIQQELKQSKAIAYRGKLISLLTTYDSIYKDIDIETKSFMQREIMTLLYMLKFNGLEAKRLLNFACNLVFNKNPIKTFAFFMSILLNTYFNSGYRLFEFSRS